MHGYWFPQCPKETDAFKSYKGIWTGEKKSGAEATETEIQNQSELKHLSPAVATTSIQRGVDKQGTHDAANTHLPATNTSDEQSMGINTAFN